MNLRANQETRKHLKKMDLQAKASSNELPGRTEGAQQELIQGLRELISQHRVGHFLLECHVMAKDQAVGVGVIESEDLFRGHFSDALLPGSAPM